MTEEPYRWIEAIGNRREYVADQLRGGSPVLAASLPDGILLVGAGTGHSKVFEIFDRHALAALGHPADIERLRQSLIDAAHVEGFTRSPDDVTLRRLVSFGLSPLLKTAFEQLFQPPFLTRLLLAELGSDPTRDTLVRVDHDGRFTLRTGGVMVAAIPPDLEGPAEVSLHRQLQGITSHEHALPLLLAAWERLTHSTPSPPDASPNTHSRQPTDRPWEIGWLDRFATSPDRYRRLPSPPPTHA